MKKTAFNPPQNKPKIDINKPEDFKPGGSFWHQPSSALWVYLIFIMASLYFRQGAQEVQRSEIPYSEFLQRVDRGEVVDAIVSNKVITGTLTESDPKTGKPRHFVTISLWNNDLAKELEEKGVKYTVRQSSDWLSNLFFSWVLPFGFLFLLWGWMGKRIAGSSKGFLNIGNRIRIHPEGDVKVTFEGVAGAEAAKVELGETISFLRDPTLLQGLGGHAPKGVLLVGSPGTGKTLLARAVAGETHVPFFNISSSEFIEMFVGMGAARVRELFEQARQKAPCITFIDELDAIGGARGYTLQLPLEEKFLSTQNELRSQVAILLGGRVAEEITFGDLSSGASNDLERATGTLVQQRATLDKLAQVLEEKEVLNGEEVEAIIGRTKEMVDQPQERTT